MRLAFYGFTLVLVDANNLPLVYRPATRIELLGIVLVLLQPAKICFIGFDRASNRPSCL